MLARDDLCRICGHRGARTADHIISAKFWPRDAAGRPLPGLDGPDNLQPAHGTMGAGRGRVQNRCAVCVGPDGRGRLCNQSKGARVRAASPSTRKWL
jgi:hypothetical protein